MARPESGILAQSHRSPRDSNNCVQFSIKINFSLDPTPSGRTNKNFESSGASMGREANARSEKSNFGAPYVNVGLVVTGTDQSSRVIGLRNRISLPPCDQSGSAPPDTEMSSELSDRDRRGCTCPLRRAGAPGGIVESRSQVSRRHRCADVVGALVQLQRGK